MSKRLADESVAGELISTLPHAANCKIAPAHIPTYDQPGFQRNSNKRLHLVASPETAEDAAGESRLKKDEQQEKQQQQEQRVSDAVTKKQASIEDENESLSETSIHKKRKSISPHESNGESNQRLFETEAHDTILNLARSATSKLMIQVYHRCFGKCVGLYHPSLLKNSESECIECSSCHVMLSPRGFISHTHGAKEVNVCHWGFNSYNWRDYIRLSRKQSMNNLDDDELLVQLERLKSKRYDVAKWETKLQDSPDELKTKSSDLAVDEIDRDNNTEASCQQNSRAHISAAQLQAELDLRTNLINSLLAKPTTSRGSLDKLAQLSSAYTNHLHSDTSNISRYNVANMDKNHYLWNLPPEAAAPSTSSSAAAAVAAAMMVAASSARKSSLPASMPISDGNRIVEPKTYSASLAYSQAALSLSSPSSSYRASSLPRPSPSSSSMTSMMGQLYGDTARDFAHLATSSSNLAASPFPLSNTERYIKQDLFLSTGLASYLNSKGVQPKMGEEIVNECLGLVQKARALF